MVMPTDRVLIYRDESAGDPGSQGGGERKNMGRSGGE